MAEQLPGQIYEDLTGSQRNAYEALRLLFESYGLGSLSDRILQFVREDFDESTIALMLQETPEYKQRFKANEARQKAGLPVLSPAEYIALERQYRNILESNGLPKGFYDSQDDFTDLIAKDVSPQEFNDRVQIAADAVNNSDPFYVQELRKYGLGQGDLIAAVLDQERALPQLKKIVNMSQVGAEAARQGLELSKERAAYFADLGVTQQQAQQAYQAIGEILPEEIKLGKIHGVQYGQEDIENELLGNSGLASQRRKRLNQMEEDIFSGSGAVGQRSLGRETTGQF